MDSLSLAILWALTTLTALEFDRGAIASPMPEAPTQSVSGGVPEIVPAHQPPMKPLRANPSSEQIGNQAFREHPIFAKNVHPQAGSLGLHKQSLPTQANIKSAPSDFVRVAATSVVGYCARIGTLPAVQSDRSHGDIGHIVLLCNSSKEQWAKRECFSPMEKLPQRERDISVERVRRVPHQEKSVRERETLSKEAEESLVDLMVESGATANSTNSSARKNKNENTRLDRNLLTEAHTFVWKTAQAPLEPQSHSIKMTQNTVTTSPVNTTVEAAPYPDERTSTTKSNPLIPISRSARDLLPPKQLQTQSSIPVDPDSSPTNPLPVPDTQPSDAADSADELGEIQKIRPPMRQPDLQLLLRSSVVTSSDLETSTTSFGSLGLIEGAFLLATPKLGPETRLIASGGESFVRGTTARYELVNFNLGVRHRLAPGTYAQLGWVQEQIYQQGTRQLLDNSIQLKVDRQDQLAAKLRLNSFYELRVSFSEPEELSRVTNALGVRLRHDITPMLEGAIDYRIVFDQFTTRARSDLRQQVSALAIYRFTPQVFISGSVSYVFGSVFSVVSGTEDLNNLVLGVSLGLNLF